MTFYTVLEAARRRGQVAIGYRIRRGERFEVVLNPDKTERLTFAVGDKVVVLAES
jgi:hypothetical protein